MCIYVYVYICRYTYIYTQYVYMHIRVYSRTHIYNIYKLTCAQSGIEECPKKKKLRQQQRPYPQHLLGFLVSPQCLFTCNVTYVYKSCHTKL